MTPLSILLVSTWQTPCGIAESAAYLKASVEAADPAITVLPSAAALDPAALLHGDTYATSPSIIWLNYHAALHSRWTSEVIARVRQTTTCPILVTYHDSGVPNSEQCRAVCAAADFFVLHEPYDDLPAHGTYLRQGIPARHSPIHLHPSTYAWPGQPLLGTVGFPFPWKNIPLLCRAAALAGWGLLLLTPGASQDQMAEWVALHPGATILPRFLARETVGSYLAACDATAFPYVCANTGTSGAIRQGLAARKPVLTFTPDAGNRQVRDLFLDPLGREVIFWLEDGSPEGVAEALRRVRLGPVDPGLVALSARDGWDRVGMSYARILRTLQKRTEP